MTAEPSNTIGARAASPRQPAPPDATQQSQAQLAQSARSGRSTARVWPPDTGSVEQLSSREVYRNAWMRVREDAIRRDDGSAGVYGVVDKPDFALVLPRGDSGFWLVEQFRYPVRRRAWEFPQGTWGAGASGSPVELARAELAEETGLRAAELTHLGRLATAYGFCSQHFDVYVATGLREGDPSREATEQDMVHRWFPDAEVDELIRAGGMVDSSSLAALTLYRLATAT